MSCRPTAVGRAEARGRLHLPVHAGPDPDHRGGLVQSGQPLVLPAARLLVAMVGRGVRTAMAAAAVVQPGTRDLDGTDLRRRRRAAGIRLPALRVPRQGTGARDHARSADPAQPGHRHRVAAVPVADRPWALDGILGAADRPRGDLPAVLRCAPSRSASRRCRPISNSPPPASARRRSPCCAMSRCRSPRRACSPA